MATLEERVARLEADVQAIRESRVDAALAFGISQVQADTPHHPGRRDGAAVVTSSGGRAVGEHSTGWLSPTPRGSNPATS